MRTLAIGSMTLRIATLPRIYERLAHGAPGGFALGYLNPHVYNLAASQPQVARFLEGCECVCLDGIGTALAARILGRSWLPRLVMDQVFDGAVVAGLLRGEVVLLGLTAPEIAAAGRALLAAAPGVRITGAYDGFRTDAEYAGILKGHAGADFVLAGMGTPRSEAILGRAAEWCPRAVRWHVGGGTLRNWAGTKRRAPRWVSRLGLEWAHRMLLEPTTRSRYAAGGPLFAWRLARDVFSP